MASRRMVHEFLVGMLELLKSHTRYYMHIRDTKVEVN